MHNKLAIFLVVAVLLSSCSKTQQNSACGTQVCTKEFAAITVHFIDKAGNSAAVSNFTVFNLRSNKQLYTGLPNFDLLAGYYVVASDSNIKDYSAEGDMIRVSAGNPATNETKTVNFKISGGCNCHVAKISGPDQVQFD